MENEDLEREREDVNRLREKENVCIGMENAFHSIIFINWRQSE